MKTVFTGLDENARQSGSCGMRYAAHSPHDHANAVLHCVSNTLDCLTLGQYRHIDDPGIKNVAESRNIRRKGVGKPDGRLIRTAWRRARTSSLEMKGMLTTGTHTSDAWVINRAVPPLLTTTRAPCSEASRAASRPSWRLPSTMEIDEPNWPAIRLAMSAISL